MTYTTYDGTFGDVLPLDLGAVDACTVVWDLEDTAPGQTTKILLEYSTNFNSRAGFMFLSESTTYALSVSQGNNLNYNAVRFTRPAPGMHRYALVLDRSANPAPRVWMDGAELSTTQYSANGLSGNYLASANLYIMARAQSSLFAQGVANVPTVYLYAMTPAEAAAASEIEPDIPAVELTLTQTLPALFDTLSLESFMDTSTRNRLNGRNREGSAYLPDNADGLDVLPAAAVKDKALVYPMPNLIDGRPT